VAGNVELQAATKDKNDNLKLSEDKVPARINIYLP
jgi:hypothetical protein